MKQMENNTIAKIKTKQQKPLWMGSVAEQKRNYQGILNGTIEISQSEWKRKKKTEKKFWIETQGPEALYKMI